MSVSKDTAKKNFEILFGTLEIFLFLELLYKSCFILISPAGGIFKLDFPTFVYKNTYTPIVIKVIIDVHLKIAKVP